VKLTIEMIPNTCAFSNIRTCIKPSQWDKIRKLSYSMAMNRCEICEGRGKRQGFKHDLECHEIFEYDDVNKVQKLIGLVSLCPICHLVKHFGRASAIGKQAICMKQLQKLNSWTHKDVVTYLKEVYELHKERSKYEWKLDLSILNEDPYNLKLDLNKERVFKVKKYRKRKHKKKNK
jgi:hypothetical protein